MHTHQRFNILSQNIVNLLYGEQKQKWKENGNLCKVKSNVDANTTEGERKYRKLEEVEMIVNNENEYPNELVKYIKNNYTVNYVSGECIKIKLTGELLEKRIEYNSSYGKDYIFVVGFVWVFFYDS
mgnify:CR=1 FL=1